MFKIYTESKDSVLLLAAKELVKYGKGAFSVTENAAEGEIILQLEKEVRKLEDRFSLKSSGNKLYITGSNPRSVLYGIYEYLKSFGFAFLYPGEEGEILPDNPAFTLEGFDKEETGSRMFRGMAFRPSAKNVDKSLEEGKELLSFMVKNKYNIFFMEGFDVDRPGDAYSIINGVRPTQHVEYSISTLPWEERKVIAEKQALLAVEARKWGLLVERGGHGWNYGVPEHYGKNHNMTPEEAKNCLKAKGKINKQAEVAVSTWFQICIAEEEVRDIYVEHVIDYLLRHRGEIDIAAFWLGDGYDNKCQCEKCLKQPFSDLYLDIFRKIALKCKELMPELILECLIYFETLEPPTKNFLEGLDNVILNYAVWRQCYFHKLDDHSCRLPDWIPDYRNNRSHDTPNDKRIINIDQHLPYEGWRKIVGNDIPCLVFTYTTYYEGFDRNFLSFDMDLMEKNSFADFDRFHIHGLVNCHCFTFWNKPANLQLYAMGRILWNKNDRDMKQIRKELFAQLYGEKAERMENFAQEVADTLCRYKPYHKSLEKMPEAAADLKKELMVFREKVKEFAPLPCNRERYFEEAFTTFIALAERCEKKMD